MEDFFNSTVYSLAPGVILPLVFAALTALAPGGGGRAKVIRSLALIGTLAPVLWYAALAFVYPWASGEHDQFPASSTWFELLGLKLSFGADTVSMLLVGLTVLLGPICVLASWTAITDRLKTYYTWLLVLQAAMTGVFLARDLILFYTFFEFTLVPLYILINLYGSTNRKAAATKFFLYTFTGSIITLAGLVYIAWQHKLAHNVWSLDFHTLEASARTLSFKQQAWLMWALLAGFAIKVPLFPLHTWLPLAHTEAPTAGSVILAGVLLKLGTYVIYRFVLGMLPAACTYYAPTLAVICIIGIVYAGLICWVQSDVKKLVAYSSVSHLGYCVLGLFALNAVGLTGSVLYMINHGLSTGALFLLVGMMYERYHTRSLKEVGGLARAMPIWATFMVFFTMASIGLPGLNGFVSELLCTLGAFQAGGTHGFGADAAAHAAVDVWSPSPTDSVGHIVPKDTTGLLPGATWGELGPWYALAAGTGVIVTAMYLLYMLGKIVWGPLREPGGHGHAHAPAAGALPRDLTRREIGLLLPLAALCLLLGLYPAPLLHVLEKPTGELARSIQINGRDHLPAGDPRLPKPTETASDLPTSHAPLPTTSSGGE